jgi:hypothetical protein
MPRYFFNISDGIKARDFGGIILADECLLTSRLRGHMLKRWHQPLPQTE